MKLILYIPISVEIDESYVKNPKQQLSEIKKSLANAGFGTYGGGYSYEKKKCKIKDILTKKNLWKQNRKT